MRTTAITLCLAATLAGAADAQERLPHHRAPDVVFVATPMEVVTAMLDLAGVGDSDVVYDLGSGDGRIVIAAARRHHARAVGIDLDPVMVREGRANADTARVVGSVEFRQADFFQTDLRSASVVTLYLGRALNERLRPLFYRDLRPGSRIVSQAFDMGDWEPDSVVQVRSRAFSETPVHLWIMPAYVAGQWHVAVQPNDPLAGTRLRLKQRYQRVRGTASGAGPELPVERARVRGNRITFMIGSRHFAGRIAGAAMEGTVTTSCGDISWWRAARDGAP